MVSATALRVDRLLAYLESDPDNRNLMADAAAAALDEGRAELAEQLVDRYAALAPPPPALVNLAGLAAMRQGRYDAAAARFEDLLGESPDDPTLRYNLAWARAGAQDWAGVAALLDETVAEVIPAAATLKVQALHQMVELEDALAWGAGFLERRPGDPALLGALSAVAMDAEEMALAADYAQRAGDTPEALVTLGLLRLDQAQPADAVSLFDRALEGGRDNGRALLGKGLAALAQDQAGDATRHLDHAAGVFGDHLGAWVAAGWAYFVAGDLVRARQRFETALALDDTFAEAHGGLAVLDVVEKRFDEARRGARTALRLDRECFSGVLARSLLLEADGDPAAAERLRQAAMDTPVGPSGQTIAQALAMFAPRQR
jgi:tetratricopeptide (TPR) repeat protein